MAESQPKVLVENKANKEKRFRIQLNEIGKFNLFGYVPCVCKKSIYWQRFCLILKRLINYSDGNFVRDDKSNKN